MSDTDCEEPPTKVTKYDESNATEEYIEEMEEGQEEWLSEELLTDDDYNPPADLDQNDSNFGNSSQDETQNIPTANTSVEPETQPEKIESIEKMLTNMDNQSQVSDELDKFLIRKTDGKVVEKEEDPTDDGNDTDDLLRLLGEGDEKTKKKVLVKTIKDKGSREKVPRNQITKEVSKTRHDSESSDEDDDFVFEGAKVTKLKVAKNALIRNFPATKAVPEEMSDEDDDGTDASSEEVKTMNKMFGVKARKPSKNVASKSTTKPPQAQPKSMPKKIAPAAKVKIANTPPSQKQLPTTTVTPPTTQRQLRNSTITKSTQKRNVTPSQMKLQDVTVTSTPKQLRNTTSSQKQLRSTTVTAKTSQKQLQSTSSPSRTQQRTTVTAKSQKQPKTSSPSLTQKTTTTPKSSLKQLPNTSSPSQKQQRTTTTPKSSPKPTVKLAQKVVNTKPASKTVKLPEKITARAVSNERRPHTLETDEIIREEEFLEDDDFDLDEDFAEPSDDEFEVSRERQLIMRPEQMDEEVPTDGDSDSDNASLYDELPSSDSEDLDDWFTLDIRAERAADYIPLLGTKAFELLSEEKSRVSERLTTLRARVAELADNGQQQDELIKKASLTIAELDDMLKAAKGSASPSSLSSLFNYPTFFGSFKAFFFINMSETVYEAPRRHVAKMRVHDYLYDSAFVVSGAKDYARMAFRAAMASAQVVVQPVYHTMFSEIKSCPRMRILYHPNCRLPAHMDRSYGAYMVRVERARQVPSPELSGKDRFKFSAFPKQILAIPSTSPEFHPPTPVYMPPASPTPKNKGVQSIYRESSAQTTPWQPDGKPADCCRATPEVLYLDKLEWGPGKPYRTGDLPADFHTTEIINKLRHARCWTELVEKGVYPRWMKKMDGVIIDVETKDWVFREAEIDELQDIRLTLLHQLQSQTRQKQTSRTSKKLDKLWAAKKQEMEKKIDHIRKTRDRELRKLTALHGGGGRVGLVQRMRASRGSEPMTLAANDPTSDLHAPLARHGYQARRRHADIEYDPTLLSLEDHKLIAKPPAWLDGCGQDLKRSCSGHHLPRDSMQLCERETKWSEQFLENLHNDLKKARLGAAAMSAGPLHVLKPRQMVVTTRPATPVVEAVDDEDENSYQAALLLQKIIRGRAVQNLMYQGLTQAAELTEELKTTHGLQKEDKVRIAREEAKAREYHAVQTEAEQKDAAVTALIDELCGGAVSAALDFLEKELCRLKEERRQHAYIMIAVREKQMREAAEAGRRQKEEHRRREHDEMFKQVLGVTQETVDAYLREIITEGVELAAEQDAVHRAQQDADRVEQSLVEHGSMSTAEQNELVAELVQQFLLPEAHKTASRHKVSDLQRAKIEGARKAIFGLLDDAEMRQPMCIYCGAPLGELCRCAVCPINRGPVETSSRDDPRWKHTTSRPRSEPKTPGERFPPAYDIRGMLDALVDEVVSGSRTHRADVCAVHHTYKQRIRERTEVAIDAKDMIETMIDRATGTVSPPDPTNRMSNYHHFMLRVVGDALERSVPFERHDTCSKELPSEIRRKTEEATKLDPTCYCEEQQEPRTSKVQFGPDTEEEKTHLLPSELRILEEMRRCKCDLSPEFSETDTEYTAGSEFDHTAAIEQEEKPLEDS